MRFATHHCVRTLTITLSLLCGLAAVAASAGATKPATAPAKPAVKAPAAKTGTGTAGKAGGATTGGKTGPTTGGHTGPTTSNPGGRTTLNNANHQGGGSPALNRTATGRPLANGSHTMATRNGAVTRRADGRVSDIHDNARGMGIHRGLDGSRHVSVERADHSRLYAERGRRGYIERRYDFHGHDYNRRAYYWHGHEYNRYYRGYYYHGAYMGVYAPGMYFAPGFYGWAYNPWYAPVAYGWGWGSSPLVRILRRLLHALSGLRLALPLAHRLPDLHLSRRAYEARQAQASGRTRRSTRGSRRPPALTPEVKAQIAAEVQSQIALENAEARQNAQGAEPDPASSGIDRMFSDGTAHAFVVGDSLDVVDASGQECALSDGDALQLASPPAPNATAATWS